MSGVRPFKVSSVVNFVRRRAASSPNRSLCSLVVAAFIATLPGTASASFNAYFQATPNPNTGDYTLTWDPPSGRTHVQERYNGGNWSGVGGRFPSPPLAFTNKAIGTYEYRLQWDHQVCPGGGRTRRDCEWVTEYSSVRRVDVLPPPPYPESLADQRQYEFKLHVGDFDGNGHPDMLLDRLTPGPLDGSMQTVIVEGRANGPSVVVPTQSELDVARTYPTNPNVKLGASDNNIDGFADILIVGLEALNSPAYPYDCLILYASGAGGVAQPLGLQFLDENYMEFFGSIAQAVADPLFYQKNTTVTVRPVFEVGIECPFRYGDNTFFWSLWDCRVGIYLVDFEVQVTGIGFHPDAPTATDAMDRIRNDDFDGIDPWKTLSDTLENIIGVPSFGFRPDGSRQRTNYTDPNDPIDDDYGEIEERWWFTIDLRIGRPPEPEPIEEWDRHDYDVETTICSTVGDTVFTEPRPRGATVYRIPQAVCTLQNVFCWAKRRPAPRDNGSEATIQDQEASELWGLTSTNPIQTHVFDGPRVIVNETLSGHELHDRLQDTNCARFDVWMDINENSPRCAYVHRKVDLSPNGSAIEITTHGEGNNPGIFDKVNDVVGPVVFDNVDDWIRRKLAREGACMDDP